MPSNSTGRRCDLTMEKIRECEKHVEFAKSCHETHADFTVKKDVNNRVTYVDMLMERPNFPNPSPSVGGVGQ